MKNEAPMIGGYGKLKSGQIVEVKAWDDISQEYDVVAPDGTKSTAACNEISRLSPNEHLAFLQTKITSGGSDF